MCNKTKYKTILILLMPFILFILNLHNMHKMQISFVETVDPEYIHLVSSIHLAEFHPEISSIESPATTLYVFGAIVSKSVFLISGQSEALTDDFIRNPEKYIYAMRFALIVFSAISLFFLGHVAIKKTNHIFLTLLLQLSPFLSTDILYSCTIIAPENFLIILVPLYTSAIICFLYDKIKINESKYVFIFSLLAAIGIATKVTFIPLVILPLFILEFKNSIKYTFLTFGFTLFLAFTATIQYERFFEWIKNLIVHSGKYGAGEENIVNARQFMLNLKAILISESFFISLFFILIFTIVICHFHKKEKGIAIKLLFGLLTVFAFQLIITAKHFSIRYLTPSLMLSGFAVFIVLKTIYKEEVIFKNQKFNRSIIAFILIFFLASFNKITSVTDDKDNHRKSRMSAIEFLEKNNTAPILIVPNYFGSSAKEYALNFSSTWSGIYKDDFIKKLNKIYPNRYFYFHAQNKYYDWMNETTLFDILKNHPVLNVYVSLDATDKTEIEFAKEINKNINEYNNLNDSAIKLTTLLKSRFDWVCKLEIDTAKLTKYFKFDQVVCDMEEITKDNSFYVSYKDSLFINSNHRLRTNAFSGIYAEKLDKQNPWGIGCSINSVTRGNYYEASVWVKNNDDRCYVIATSEDYKTLYISSNTKTEDKNGWKKIKVSFKVDEKIENSTIKFFVWYQGDNFSYVDDFALKTGYFNNSN